MNVDVDLSQVRIETERLRLRAFQEADLKDFFTYASVPGVGEMAGWRHHETLNQTWHVLENFMREKDVLAIWHKQDQKVIGSVGLHASWANEDPIYAAYRSKEIGYVLSKSYWGNGLMPEAVSVLIDFCFEKLDIDLLTCAHFTSNQRSRRVIEKVGFKYVRDGIYEAEQLKQSRAERCYILFKADRIQENSGLRQSGSE